MRWTDEQKAAIDTKNCKLLVAAGAGSGKTAVLVQRIIDKIIIDKIDIDKMLIVTFTNAAASEMRERIRDGIYKVLETNPEMQRQLLLINKASIMTIDAFCKKVIKDNFFKLNLDPNFRVADSAENELLKLEALDEVLDELYEEDDDKIVDVMMAYSNNKSDDNLRSILLNIHSFIQSSPFPYDWLKEKCEMYNVDEKDFAKTVWGKEITSYARSEVRGILDELQEMTEDLSSNNEAANYLLTLQDDELLLKNLLYNCNTWDDFCEYLSVCEIGKLKNAPKLDEDTKEEVKELREKMKGIVKKYLKEEIFISKSNEILLDVSRLYDTLKILSDIVIRFDKRFKEKKNAKGIIDFSDMEHLCLELLNDNESIANAYKEKYEEILIDEYQDSNLIQEFILNKISNGHMFMVGDVKQSIYRFRQARPELFLEKYETYTEDLESVSPTKKILLFKNFRSNENIIDQANFVFKNIMTKAVGEIDYTEKEYLKFGANYYPCTGTKAEIDVIEKKLDKEEIEEDLENDIEDTPQLEGRVIAKRIEELVGNFEIYDKKKEIMRKAKYSDIVILLRATKGYADTFVSELAKRNIPAFADINTGYFENTEVQIVLSLLKIIDNPYQDIPLIAVMRSQIGGFTPDELTSIRLIDKNASYYETLQKAATGNKKVKDFINKLDSWREKSKNISLDELIWYLYEETGYYYYVSLLPDGKIRTANLKMLLDKATAYDKTSYRGLFNFINFLDNLKESSGDMGSSKQLSENDNVVRIMSIHKSKGLEFPIVFLSGTARKFNTRDMSNPIILHQDLGFGADIIDTEKRIYYSSMPKLALKLKTKQETLSEEMRILYVALTRAREKLIVTALESDIGKKLDKWSKGVNEYKVASSNNFADWICSAVINNENDFEVKEWSYNDVLRLAKEDEAEECYVETILKGIDSSLKETEDYKFIDDRLNWKYKYSYSTKIPNKVTVTELKRLNTVLEQTDEVRITDIIEKPSFMSEEGEKNASGTAYGTLVHNLMQRLDFNNPNVSEIIKSVNADEKTKKLLEKQINEFLQTNFYSEVKKAKKVYKEAPFNLEVKAEEVYDITDDSKNDILMIQGIVDMYYETEEGLVLVDYKTDKVENELELIKRYKKQLDYYKEALERLTEKKVSKMYIYSFSLKKEIEM